MAVEAGLGRLQQRLHVEDGGVVDQDVDAAEPVHRRPDHGTDRCGIAYVEPHRERAVPDVAGKGLCLVLSHVGNDDPRTFGRVSPHDRFANPLSTTGNNGSLVLQLHCRFPQLYYCHSADL
jgi:hypothetical protein